MCRAAAAAVVVASLALWGTCADGAACAGCVAGSSGTCWAVDGERRAAAGFGRRWRVGASCVRRRDLVVLRAGSCVAFDASGNCPAGSCACGVDPLCPGTGCADCVGTSGGNCHSSTGVCWEQLPWGGCPVGTTPCGANSMYGAPSNSSAAFAANCGVCWGGTSGPCQVRARFSNFCCARCGRFSVVRALCADTSVLCARCVRTLECCARAMCRHFRVVRALCGNTYLLSVVRALCADTFAPL